MSVLGHGVGAWASSRRGCRAPDGAVGAAEWDTSAEDRYAAIDCDGDDHLSTAG